MSSQGLFKIFWIFVQALSTVIKVTKLMQLTFLKV